MTSLKYKNFRFYWTAVTENRYNNVVAKVSYICAGILSNKSTISL